MKQKWRKRLNSKMSVILGQKLSKGSEYGELDQNGLQRPPASLSNKILPIFHPACVRV